MYIGETGCLMKIILKEHYAGIIYVRPKKSFLVEHSKKIKPSYMHGRSEGDCNGRKLQQKMYSRSSEN